MLRLLLVVCLVIGMGSSIVWARIIYQGKNPGQIALTFDDGPTPDITNKILDVLKREKVKATFFVIGQKVVRQPQLIRRMSKEKHEIGNHTYNHSKLTWINNRKIIDELKKTSELIASLTGRSVNLFRPPHGALTGEKRQLVEERGYDIIMWSINADDFWHKKTGMRHPDSIVRRVVTRLKGGDIILMHDNSQQIVKALPKIIKELKKKGFYFVTISQLIGRKT